MHINFKRSAKFGSLVFAGALATTMAHATTFNIGGFEVNMDTTVSTGLTYLVSDRNDSYLPEGNGGNPNLNLSFDIANGNASCVTTTPVYGGFCQEIAPLGSTSQN